MSGRGLRQRQRGVALLVTLVLVAVVTILVVAMLDDIRFGLRRAGNAALVAQAQWHALGAEAVARKLVVSRPEVGRNGHAFEFPIEDEGGPGGRVHGRLEDATACFNLNSVVEGAGEQWQRRADGVAQFVALQEALGLPRGSALELADTLVDWIDADQQPGERGAEDAAYLAREPRQLTASTLLAEPSELRALRGMTPATYALLRPWVCALPDVTLSPVNVNALDEGDLPIVRMLAGGAIGAAAAQRVIAARPAGGWSGEAQFWAQPALAAVQPSPAVHAQVHTRSRYYRLQVAVEHGDAQVELTSLFGHDGGRTRLLARRWNTEE